MNTLSRGRFRVPGLGIRVYSLLAWAAAVLSYGAPRLRLACRPQAGGVVSGIFDVKRR